MDWITTVSVVIYPMYTNWRNNLKNLMTNVELLKSNVQRLKSKT